MSQEDVRLALLALLLSPLAASLVAWAAHRWRRRRETIARRLDREHVEAALERAKRHRPYARRV